MTWSFISKNYLTSLPALRHLFFSPGTPDGDLEEWQRLLNEQSTPLKLLDLTKLRVRASTSHISAALGRTISMAPGGPQEVLS